MLIADTRLGEQRAEQLNQHCHCVALDRDKLRQALATQTNGDKLFRMICEERPHLVADAAVFVGAASLKQQRDIIEAVERVVALPAYHQRVLRYAPDSAQHSPNTHGVFLGYDFHLGKEGSKLIEINSNAGGALLNVWLARAHSACEACEWDLVDVRQSELVEQLFIDMFQTEWRLAGRQQPLRTIAIVDQDPSSQYMLPEFLLFQNLFAAHQLQTVICDPSELQHHHGKLWFGERAIDLVYNRLTDFSLEQAAQQALHDAYLADDVVVTPHPRNHALYADKRNLALLTDDAALQELGVDTETRRMLLQGIARTTRVEAQAEDQLWQQRKQLFFKPAKGYGSKAAYRGDKLTRRVFAEILAGDYVAQALVQPSERQLNVDAQAVELKLDLRHFVYQRQTQWLCARLYQGQTTNFRTPGGGFAQVVVVP